MKRVIVIMGASGTGKSTVSAYLTQQFGIPRVLTHTTRPARQGEVSGVDYYFETPASFAQNHYLEAVTYSGYQYGSSYEGLTRAWAQNDLVSIILDTAGGLTYQHALGAQFAGLFLTVPDAAHLADRLVARGDAPARVAARLASAETKRDLTLPPVLAPFTTVVVNADWAATKRALAAFVATLTA